MGQNNRKDIRNEAFYYKLKAIISNYKSNYSEKIKFIEKAIELYSLMNCKQDIVFLENMKWNKYYRKKQKCNENVIFLKKEKKQRNTNNKCEIIYK